MGATLKACTRRGAVVVRAMPVGALGDRAGSRRMEQGEYGRSWSVAGTTGWSRPPGQGGAPDAGLRGQEVVGGAAVTERPFKPDTR